MIDGTDSDVDPHAIDRSSAFRHQQRWVMVMHLHDVIADARLRKVDTATCPANEDSCGAVKPGWGGGEPAIDVRLKKEKGRG